MAVDAVQLRVMSCTFMSSLRSVGTALSMASVGYYLNHTSSIGSEGKRAFAVLSQQITIPLFLFSKILYCKQDGSDDPCPDVTQSLADVWMLLLWPFYVVGIGCLIGLVVAKVTNTPGHHVSTVLAACAFGNASALPITLLNVIHSSFPPTSDFGRIDPTLFLSVFMLLYPALLWGFGGWLLDYGCKIPRLPTRTVVDDDDDDGKQNLELTHVPDSKLPLELSSNAVKIRLINCTSRQRSASANEDLAMSEQ
jgi:hypothetical protein